MFYNFFFFFFFFLFVLFLKMFHLLSFLIVFEVLGFYLISLMMGGYVFLDLSYVFFSFFTISVCESVLGLVLFVLFARYFSKDYLFSFSLLSF